MTVLASDSFNRANSTTTLGTTDSYMGGTPRTWQKTSAVHYYGINSNQAYEASGATDVNEFAYLDIPETTNYIYSIDLSNPADILKIMLRGTDLNNLISFEVPYPGSAYDVYDVINGAYTRILRTSAKIATGDKLQITLNSNQLSLKINGIAAGSGTTSVLTGNRVGFSALGRSAILLDNFIIEDLNTGGTTTTYTGSGTLQGTSTLSQPEKLIYKGSGTLQGTSNVSSIEKAILKVLGTLQGFSSLTSSETYTTQTGTTYTGGGILQGSSIVSGTEHYFYKANGTLQGLSNLSSGETLILFTGNIYSASGTVQGFSTLSASEKIIYKEISTTVGYSDNSVHEIVTLLASGIAQGYSNVLLIDQTEVIAQVSLIGKQRIEVTLVGKQKLDATLQGKQRITINLKGVMK